jgi:hypothetical protein
MASSKPHQGLIHTRWKPNSRGPIVETKRM